MKLGFNTLSPGRWIDISFFGSIAVLIILPEDIFTRYDLLGFVILTLLLIGIARYAYLLILFVTTWLLKPQVRPTKTSEVRPTDWGDDWGLRSESIRSLMLWPFRTFGRLFIFSMIWMFWFLRRPTMILLYVFAVPVAGIWFVWHTIDTRFAAIETALGGPVKMRCNRYQAIKDVAPSVVRIIGGEGEGSGFVFEKGRVLTNHHVIADEPSPKIVYSDGTFDIGSVFATDPFRDLAVISIDKDIPPLRWAEGESVPVGEQVLTMGFPWGGQLDGAVTVNDTTVSGDRVNSSGLFPVYYIQLAGGTIAGMSGGPVIDLCGNVIGVNDLGSRDALSLALDKVTAKKFISDVWSRPSDYRSDITKIEFNPDESPEQLVRAYYNYLKIRNFPEAYRLLSENFIGDVEYDSWVKGFEYELDTTVGRIEVEKRYPMRVKVWLSSTDFENGVFTYKSFTGSWLVRKIDGHLRLWESNIKDVSHK